MSLSDKNYIRKVFIKYGNKVRFKVGQSLSSDSYISGKVNFIESGEARIIFNDNGRFPIFGREIIKTYAAEKYKQHFKKQT